MLDSLLNPNRVAVVGASREEGKVGHEIFDNLSHGFRGNVYPVNPEADEIHGHEAFDGVREGTDLAVIAVPAGSVPEVLEDCGEKGVNAAIVVSAGFSEVGNDRLESRVLEIARENSITLLGPNVLGLINTENGMNASFASKMPEEGDISFMSQSGAFCTAILDHAKSDHIGFRHFVSLGNKAMLDETGFLDLWRQDSTGTILGYTEGIESGREFMEKARSVSREKPVVMVKSGRTEEGGGAASSHTGSIAGSYEAYRAAFRQSGVIEAESSRELLDYGRALDYQPLPPGGSVAVVTNAGGPGVVTADEIAEHGLDLASFSRETRRELKNSLPDEATVDNPVDLVGDAGHERYKKALEAVLDDGGVDSAVVVLTPQTSTEVKKTAKTVVDVSRKCGKPVMASFMGEDEVSPGVEILEENGVPDFQDPMDAVKVLEAMNRYQEFLDRDRTLREVEFDSSRASEALDGYSGFSDGEKLLKAYGFDVALTQQVDSAAEAVEAATRVGFPAVLKLDSSDIAHKTELDGVETGITGNSEMETAFRDMMSRVHGKVSGSEINGAVVQEEIDGLEIALGMKRDPQFGPLVMVGLGGIYVEAVRDVSFGVAPVSEEFAGEMIEELRSHELFEGFRGKESHVEQVKNAIIRLGEIGLNHPEIQSIDLNPVILKGGTAHVTDITVEMED